MLDLFLELNLAVNRLVLSDKFMHGTIADCTALYDVETVVSGAAVKPRLDLDIPI